ncbi:hypothetical protein QN357_13865 [Cryobacterium sp. RTC2.1]|uniref:hypothetical protein n=1 Tax=Cryobacterium sp. RTC2.1 TaxID=3048634 RepID=UPI002B23D136|nr:hypothetical protein [Cryobacterium sp. RTC2.1]MEB0004013.1 hypothetical protein [Cryobacterium sp. RTC2.1]
MKESEPMSHPSTDDDSGEILSYFELVAKKFDDEVGDDLLNQPAPFTDTEVSNFWASVSARIRAEISATEDAHSEDFAEQAAQLVFEAELLLVLPSLDRRVRAAASDPSKLPEVHRADRGISVQVSSIGPATAHVVVSVEPYAARPLDVVGVVWSDGPLKRTHLLVLNGDEGSLLVSEATIRTESEWLDVSILMPRAIADLSESLSTEITQSVAAASPTNQLAWRAIAALLQPGDPIFNMIRDGLTFPNRRPAADSGE